MPAYVHYGDSDFDRTLAGRTVAGNFGFLIPHLQRGMRVLDCGSGPGSVTLGVAEVVAPGLVVGVDLEPRQAAAARARAAARRATGASFLAADAARLPFADASFDAVVANSLLMHVAEPLAALREMRRVLVPGGVAGIRDPDEGATLLGPSGARVAEIYALTLRALAAAGGHPFAGRDHRGLLLAAGFSRTRAQVTSVGAGDAAQTREAAAVIEGRLRAPVLRAIVERAGWADAAALDEMGAEVRAWGERPDAFYSACMCWALGWN